MNARRVDRFWRAVQQGSEDACWPWQQSRTRGGYGQVLFVGRRTTAHRIAFELSSGPIPEGHYVLHRCDNPPCCNPRHLFTGTQKQNIEDMHQKGRAGDCRVIGEAHGMVKLTDEQVRQLRAVRAAGKSQDAIAAQFRIGQTQVGRILRGESRVTA